MRKPKPEFPTTKTPVWAPAASGFDLNITITLQLATKWKQEHGKGGN